MSHQDEAEALIAGIPALLDRRAFMDARTIEERIDQANRAAGTRLYSHHLAMLWADCLLMWSDALDGNAKRSLVREMLLLSPQNESADGMLAVLLAGREPAPRDGAPVFMIVSCRLPAYLDRGRRLRDALLAHGAIAWIVVADEELQHPQWHDEGVIVPASDAYEGLPMKVARGIQAIIERYGPCPIVKIDDDCMPAATFSLDAFVRWSAAHGYVGVPFRDPLHDRLWHHGKTSRPMGVYSRRFLGQWANGPCYLLGARAALLVARESILFPGELSCELYEEKAIGDLLRRQGIALHALPGFDAFGVDADLRERVPSYEVGSVRDGTAAPVADASQPEPRSKDVAPTAAEPAGGSRVVPLVPPVTSRPRIPKQLHLIWVGDDTKRPDNCIRTWADTNPDWIVKLWGNDDVRERTWANARHMAAMWDRELNGVADLMRWELLYTEGGIVVDADSVCVRPLDDWLLESEAIACWENELTRPQLIACNMVGSVPENPFFGRIIEDLHARPSVVDDMAWKTVGPMCLTEAFLKYRYTGLTILPSHLFIPDHFSGVHYSGGGLVYARQEWASTHRAYDTLHLKKVS